MEEMSKWKPRADTLFDAEILLQRRDHIQHADNLHNWKRLRLKTYNFLDHPKSLGSFGYHFAIFAIVLLTVVLGATTETLENHWVIEMYHGMEKVLLTFFLIEFSIRFWAMGADAKYIGWRGKLKYLKSFICLVDITIIFVTCLMLFTEKNYISKNTLDYLRFIQILRLFHIDRQMSTFRLLKNMIVISRNELLASYFITFVLFTVLSLGVHLCETSGTLLSFGGNESKVYTGEKMPTLAHSWWFSAVTILTIGYGDMVPEHWMSKLLVCTVGFMAYCTFVTASTQISVGLTLMMEEDHKKEYKNKLRNVSASVIQCWWRYILASRLQNGNVTRLESFKHFCYKLYLTGERLKKIREFEAKKKRYAQKKGKSGSQKRNSESNLVAHTEQTTTELLKMMAPMGMVDRSSIHHSNKGHLQRYLSLPYSSDTDKKDLSGKEKRQQYQHKHSQDSSSSFGSDTLEHSFDHLHLDKHSSTDNSLNCNDIDECIILKFQPLLRFFNFLLFHENVKKFRRLRKADRMLEMEAEMIEKDHERDQKMKGLEAQVGAVIGKPVVSFLSKDGEKMSMVDRVELMEAKMEEMDAKVAKIDELAALIMETINKQNDFVAHAPVHIGRGRLSRQLTIDALVKEEDEEEKQDLPM